MKPRLITFFVVASALWASWAMANDGGGGSPPACSGCTASFDPIPPMPECPPQPEALLLLEVIATDGACLPFEHEGAAVCRPDPDGDGCRFRLHRVVSGGANHSFRVEHELDDPWAVNPRSRMLSEFPFDGTVSPDRNVFVSCGGSTRVELAADFGECGTLVLSTRLRCSQCQ